MNRSERKSRDEQVVTMRREGRTLAEIGQCFDLTRERIRQICDASGVPWQDSRAFISQAELAPFIPLVHTRNCPVCRQPRTPNAQICDKCKKFISVIRNIKAKLTSALNGNKTSIYSRNTALSLIRKHNIKPSDLEKA